MNNNTLIERILDTQESMSKDIGDIKIDLKYHVKRTNLLEDSVQLQREELATLVRKLESEMKPIKNHIDLINAVLKLIGGLSVLVSIGAGVVKILAYFS